MAYNGSGTFLINTAGQPVVSGTVISSTAFNALTADLATGLSTAITKDGQTTVTANIPMSTYKFTGLGVGSAATDSANLSQVQSTVTKLLNSVSGADTITATASPTLAAYAAGQMFYFVAAGDNTTSVTLNIDSLGAKAVTRDGATALAAADIKSGEVVVVVYDGTRFQVVSQLNSAGDARFANVSIASSLYVGGVSTFVGNAGFSANVSIASALSVGGVAAITGATTIGGNLTLSGGTANGVLYLNGSKVATSGANLTYSGTTLSVKAGNGDQLILNNAGERFTQLTLQNNGVTKANLNFDNTNSLVEMYGVAGTSLIFSPNATEAMRLTSTGLGIGTASPATKLEVTGDITQTWAASMDRFVGSKFSTTYELGLHFLESSRETRVLSKAADSNDKITFYTGTTPTERMRLDSSGNLGIGTASPTGRFEVRTDGGTGRAGTFYSPSTTNGAQVWWVDNNTNWTLRTAPSGGITDFVFTRDGNVTEIMRLSYGGNLGLGVTPSASSVKTFELGSVGNTLTGIGGGDIALMSNAYFNSGFKYAGSNLASSYRQQDGVHKWNIAPSGTAGNTISFTQAMTLDASGNLGVGVTSPTVPIEVQSNSGGTGIIIRGRATANSGTLRFYANNGTTQQAKFEANDTTVEIGSITNVPLLLYANGSERARITSGGIFLVGKSTTDFDTAGTTIYSTDGIDVTRASGHGIAINRTSNDGDLIQFYRGASTTVGSISVSGGTVSYNAFAGSHWSQLQDGSKPDILRGTVMESINELCVWPGEQNERLPKSKVSDTAGSKKVYGVFMAWDNDWTTTNDMYITAVGAFICRVNGSVTVQEGDLLESNGDGTARVQADDIIRSSTIGKVTSTVKTHQYADGSYCVPTVLYCG